MSLLVDTDVLIWHLRGYAQATERLDQLPALVMSSVSYFEILQGMRNKVELQAFKKMLAQRQAQLLPMTPAITARTGDLLEALTLSHGLGMGDALIAATAMEHGLTVLTGNTKHFSAVDGLQLEEFLIQSLPHSEK
jgi:predicted nucleic acid-binding protein